ncbi:response regulator transcription factor [Seleniivibrio sp.]|uniref:response regulator transcription factor n=1 Tax=Seleniivibrio sp. TaxID=2898801 RepID=UPI0025EBD1CA|nr:response regulator transcription factor [Seleniivibrio sp.]MCD8553547.1 response regulator transcription factor [Seleniivibrio sp.]
MKILYIEDDLRLAELIKDYLEKNGFEVLLAHDGEEGMNTAIKLQPEIVLLDMMLPGMNGMEICRRIRHGFSGFILFLTAQDDNMDEVAALEMGADDYITKPIEPRVLLARLRAVSRRYAGKPSALFYFCGLEIDTGARKVTLDGKEVILSPNEYELLIFLAENAGLTMSRDDISERLRGINYDGLDRTVDITVSRLRKKIGDSDKRPEKIKTVWGKGYMLVKDMGAPR